MLEHALREYGLSSEQIAEILKYYKDESELANSEDFELAAIAGLSVEEARRVKEFVNSMKYSEGKKDGNITRDFLKRWSRVLSEDDLEKAYEEYDRLSKINPNSPVIWQIKGELLEKMNRHAEAREAFKRAKMLYENQDEIPPSYLEERLHGVSYRNRHAGNGVGLVNGLGFMNGRNTSRINGFSNGFKNGIINGSGLVNGSGKMGPPRKDRAPPFFRFVISLILVAVIIYAPLMGLFFFNNAPAFAVDGNFEEWNSVMPYYNLRSSPGYINITMVKFHSTSKGLYFFVETEKPVFVNSSGIYIFIDSDMDSRTGYSVEGIGAEFMAEVYGWNGSIAGRTLYFFNSSDSHDFSKFVSIESIAAMASGNKIEGFIPREFREFRSVVISTNYAGASDITPVPEYGEPTFQVIVKNYGKVVPLNRETPVLKMEIYSFGRNVNISNMSFEFNGTAPPVALDDIALYLDDGDGEFDAGDSLISRSWMVSRNGDLVFSNLNLQVENSTVFLTVRCSKEYMVEKTIYARVSSIGANIPYSIEDLTDGGSYVGRIPDKVYIDGSFYDWLLSKNDTPGDVLDTSGMPENKDPNIDILRYGAYSGEHLYLYLSVNGHFLGGTACPIERMFTLPDSDRDTVPDRFDPYPHDFNNDGIPDDESYVVVNGEKLPDVDRDGIPDYPSGPDMWLNTTIPDNFPKPYAGKEVSVYIGPVPAKKVYGYDVVRIYINSDNNISTGFSLPQYPIGADYMVEIYGIDGIAENASLMRYAGNGSWRFVGEVKYYSGYHSIEIDSGINSPESTVLFVLSDWDGDHDISDSPFHSSVATKSVEVHKQLHLHYDSSTSTPYLNTTTGSTAYYARIYANNYAMWIQLPPFSEDFTITSYPMIHLYLDPYIYQWWYFRFIPGMNASLWIYNTTTGLREMGYDLNSYIDEPGWYNFTISNTTTVKKGEYLLLNLSVVGIRYNYIDVYFNSSDYDSLVDLPTSTYVHVDWIKTYNSSAQTTIFEPGDNLRVETEISDPFGSGDISDAKITVYYPNGTVLVDNESMVRTSSTNSSSVFSYQTTLPSYGGLYKVVVVGVESNGVVDTNATYVIVKKNEGVVIYPDQTRDGAPGGKVYFNLTMTNIGNVPDVYELVPSVPTANFPYELYIDGSLAAKDSDGDGNFDWINSSWDGDGDGRIEISLAPFQNASVTVIKEVPDGTWGETDLTIFNATSENNASVYDDVRIRVNVPYLSKSKHLYLSDTDQLALKISGTTQQVTVNYGNSYTWTYPQTYYDVNITSYIIVHLYIKPSPSSYSAVGMKASLYYDSTLIGEDRIIADKERWYDFTISPQVSRIPAGSSIKLVFSIIGYGTSATVYYDSADYQSNVSIPTTDYIRIRYLKLYKSSGYETYNFSAGDDLTVRAAVTSPFGPDDIGVAYLNITDPLGERKVDSEGMNLLSSSGGLKVYEYTYTLPQDAWSGYWRVKVDVHDDPVIHINASTRFFIPWGVNITPDHNVTTNVSSSSRELSFVHTITNTGLGANIFEIRAHSSNGFDVKLYINGELAAEDYDGDGIWDYVNSAYDLDGDGNPDTGILIPGQSMEINITVTIPANFTGSENLTVEAHSFLSQSVRDEARDRITVVPELQEMVMITVVPLAIILIKRRGRFTPS